MKKVVVREWKDLTKKEKTEAIERETNCVVDGELEALFMDLENGQITEAAYYEALGCTKSYAESTAWFIPSCFYEKNKEGIDALVKDNVRQAVYDSLGRAIYGL